MKTGIALIEEERKEHYTKHGFTDDFVYRNPGYYENSQLVQAANILSGNDETEGYMSAFCPDGWDKNKWYSMTKKPYEKRLIIAGSLIAAQYDYITGMARFKRPFTDLVKAIWFEGKQIIPIQELFMITLLKDANITENGSSGLDSSKCKKFFSFYLTTETQTIILSFDSTDNSFISSFNKKTISTPNQYKAFKMLEKWGFDLDGEIEKGTAYDINQIDINK